MLLTIQQVNWREQYPEAPVTKVDISRVPLSNGNREGLRVAFHVQGRQLRALALQDQQPVWEDSCVEFFCQVPGDDHYMNFETNCIGTMVASRRLSRTDDVQPFTPEQMVTITRHCSLPHQLIEEQDGMFDWSVEITIPLALIYGTHPVPGPNDPVVLRANCYKCGDKTRYPHFVSWQPIPLPQPDFHCPQFFGTIEL
ncbi:MAG: hypothetical protein MJZ65_00445 [Paludibacteraceae bacterium]|nr:hypothetical protein [Paludibacteraceae bacterium]